MTNNNMAKPSPIHSIVPKCVNYGYKTTPVQLLNDKIPTSFVNFFLMNAKKELLQKRYGFRNDPYDNISVEEAREIRRHRMSIKRLRLVNENIWTREHNRASVQAPRSLMAIYYMICAFVDVVYKDNPIDRFWFLETVARMPYFSYVATLHMYEALGFWEIDGDLKRLHLNEEINETMHLRVMESLGGNSLWWNRFIARHGAMGYYIILMILYAVSPRLAYLSSELLEMHAVDTYEEFYESNEHTLRQMPLTPSAYEYAPDAASMYDVFVRISTDEAYHAETMRTIRQYES
jgi:ubiquinol oxidase